MLKRRWMTLAGLVFVCNWGAAAHAKDPPEVRTQQLLDKLLGVKEAPEGGALSEADKAANAALYKELDGYFDYDRLSTEPIAPNKKAFTAAQIASFRKTFNDLIRLVAYPRSSTFVRQAKVTVKKGKAQGKRAEVVMHAALPEKDIETDVGFFWEEQDGAWRIVDVSFDGTSIIKDYQNQFTRIIKKDGVDGLLKKVSERLENERKDAS
jgi:ABC-type transporter MlaC component